MERRFQVRLRELVEDAVVEPEVFAVLMPRIERFVEPFATAMVRCEQQRHERVIRVKVREIPFTRNCSAAVIVE